MNNRLFNTPEETAARLSLLLAELANPATLERLTELDLTATYLKFFGLGATNLHGDNPHASAEYEARRARVRKGIALLVVTGLARTEDNGVTYYANAACRLYAAYFQGEYVTAYKAGVRAAISAESNLNPPTAPTGMR